jgi:hypothetical protein
MTATTPAPEPKASRPIHAPTDTDALETLLRTVGCRLPTDADVVEELLRSVTPKEGK